MGYYLNYRFFGEDFVLLEDYAIFSSSIAMEITPAKM